MELDPNIEIHQLLFMDSTDILMSEECFFRESFTNSADKSNLETFTVEIHLCNYIVLLTGLILVWTQAQSV